MLLVWFCSFLGKGYSIAQATGVFKQANKTKSVEPCSSSCLPLLYSYASNRKRGLHKNSRGKPPPAWYSTRFVDLFINAINLNVNGLQAQQNCSKLIL